MFASLLGLPQELLDHSAAHHAALQKLLGAVQECEKGRVPLLLSRSQSTKSLFDKDTSAGGSGEDFEEVKIQLQHLRSRVGVMTDDTPRPVLARACPAHQQSHRQLCRCPSHTACCMLHNAATGTC